MARGRKTSLTIRLTPAERRTLLAWQRATTISAGLARRARIILLLADGVTITDIAATVGLSRRHTYKWIQRFVQEGLEGLEDKPGRGRRLGPLPSDLRNQHDMRRGITRAGRGLPEARMGWCSPLPGGHHLDGLLCACMEHLVSAERGEHCPLAWAALLSSAETQPFASLGTMLLVRANLFPPSTLWQTLSHGQTVEMYLSAHPPPFRLVPLQGGAQP